MKNYKYIFFDLDGTLCDTQSGIKKCIAYALDKFGFSYTDEILHKMIGPPFRVGMKENFGVTPEEAEKFLVFYRGLYEKEGWMDCKMFDGVEMLLKGLKDKGKSLAVATSKPIVFTDKIIDYFGFHKYFDFVGGAETDLSRDTKALVIEYVIENLKIEDRSQILMIGDRKYDIDGARECGIDTMAILWGYGNRAEFEEHNAKYILSTPQDVLEFLS